MNPPLPELSSLLACQTLPIAKVVQAIITSELLGLMTIICHNDINVLLTTDN
ncbi:MAG: hypothetical protein V7K50_05085 [Nostoc sp.]|uniref:hypothetical protein n=1 Tax=Nostoc sp. TaxID=1180 RepID=UPI002FF562A0